MCVYECVRVCVCVRERERETLCVCERGCVGGRDREKCTKTPRVQESVLGRECVRQRVCD